MEILPDKAWTTVKAKMKRDGVRLFVGDNRGNPELKLSYHAGFGMFETTTVNSYIEGATDYDYEDGEFRLSSAQLIDLEDTLIDQVAVTVAEMDEYLIYSSKVRKANA